MSERTVEEALAHAEAWRNETSQCGDEANVYPDLVLLADEVLRLRKSGLDEAITVVRNHAQATYNTAEWLRSRHGDAVGNDEIMLASAIATVIPVLERARDERGKVTTKPNGK